MHIYIDTDLEGACGVESYESTAPGNPGYEEAYADLARDINAAVAGAFEGGADKVTVLDGHGPRGLNYDLVDPRALRADNNRGGHSWIDDYKKPYDAIFCVGYHAMAGTQNAFLDHTQSNFWYEYKINGRPTGEIGQSAIIAAHNGAPLIFLTGDEAAVAEARNFVGNIECVAVKRGLGRLNCITYDKKDVREKIRLAAARAVAAFIREPALYKPYKPALPAEMLLTYARTEFADNAMKNNPSLERTGPRTVRKVVANYLDIMP